MLQIKSDLFKARDFKNKLFLIEHLNNNNNNQISDKRCSKEIVWYVEGARNQGPGIEKFRQNYYIKKSSTNF